MNRPPRIEAFDLQPGHAITRKYEVIGKLGEGWEGEVYHIHERSTGIERAAKLFYPQRNLKNRAALIYARKLHRLRHCPIVIQYHTEEMIRYRGISITVLVSEYVEGELLSRFLRKQRGGRLSPFQAVHLLHALVVGMEAVHHAGEYHGDLHADNIIISRYGLGFDLKLLDMFHWSFPKRENIQDDICDMVRLFYDAMGGQRHYARLPDTVKKICCGLKRSLILKRFRSSSHLREYLENMVWDPD